jgi:repressor LexA
MPMRDPTARYPAEALTVEAEPMFLPLTDRQCAVLGFLVGSVREKGIMPSVRETGRALRLRSSATVHQHLKALERKGYIKKTAG